MKKNLIIILILTFLSNHFLVAQNLDSKVETEKKDTVKQKK